MYNLKQALARVTQAYGQDKAQQAYLNMLEAGTVPTLPLWLKAASKIKTQKHRYQEVPLGSRQPIQPDQGPTVETILGF